MADQDQPTEGERATHPLLDQVDQTLKYFTPDIMGRTVYCHLDKRGAGQKKCPKVRFPVPFDPEDRRPTMTDYLNAAADHVVEHHSELLEGLPELTPGAEVARARQQVQDREDEDFRAGKTEMKPGGSRSSTRRKSIFDQMVGAYRREEDGLYHEAPQAEVEPVHALRPRLRVAEEVSLADFMTDPEIHARIEAEAQLPDDIVRAGVEAFERVHPHDREDAEIIVRKVAAAALRAHEAARPGIEHQVALAKYAADQTRTRQLPGFLLADEGFYRYRFVDRAQRRLLDEVPPELSGVVLSASFKVVPQEGTSLVILRDPTPGSLQQHPENQDLFVDTLPTVLQVLFGETHSDIGVPEGDHTYVIAVHPDLLPRLDGADPDGVEREAATTTDKE